MKKLLLLCAVLCLTACAAEKEALQQTAQAPSQKALFAPQQLNYVYLPITGQSNAGQMYLMQPGYNTSATAILEQDIQKRTGAYAVTTLDKNGFQVPIVNGSSVDGDAIKMRPDKAWWHLAENKPGQALLKVLGIMKHTLQQMQASGTVIHKGVVWMHGENSAGEIGRATDPNAMLQRHFQATNAIFDFTKKVLGADTEFYIVLSPNPEPQAIMNSGGTQQDVRILQKGAQLVQHMQRQLAATRPDTHFAVDPTGLPSLFSTGDPLKKDDKWHMAPESYFTTARQLGAVVSQRVAAALQHQGR